jgi:hypothetical protein
MHASQESYDMDSIDNVRDRFAALEQQMSVMEAHTRAVERRLRWWQGFACGMVILGLRGWGLQSSYAVVADHVKVMQNDIAALYGLLWYTTNATNDQEDPEGNSTGAHLRIVNIACGGSNRTAPGTDNQAAGALFSAHSTPAR